MRRLLQLTSTYQRAAIIVTTILLLSVPILVASLSGVRDFRPQAATASKTATNISSSTFSCSSASIHWDNPSAASASDNSYATVTTSTNKYTYCLRAKAFGFNIPSGSTVDNIVIDIERKASHASPSQSVRDNRVSVYNGSTSLSSNICGDCFNENVPTSDSLRTLTYSSSKLTTSVINSSNFTISYQAYVTNATAYVDQIKVTVNYTPPPPPPEVSLTADDTSIAYDTSTTLRWSTTDATSCTASGSWSGSKTTSGSQSTGNLTSSRTYTLSCSGSGGSDSDSVTVNVGSPPPTPTVSLSVSPTSISSGASSTLFWSSSNATSCSASGSWSGSKSLNGSQSTGSLTGPNTFTYTLTCSNSSGNDSDSASVSVSSPPPPPKPTVNITANPTSISSGASSTLSWSSSDATSVTISPGVGTVGSSGSTSVSPSASTTYQAVASGLGGNSDPEFASITVNSQPPPPPPPKPTLSFSASPTSITSGESSTLSWSSSNATSVTITPDIGTVGANGSTTVKPGSSISYTAVASGAGGNSSAKSVSITVNGVPPPPPPPPPTTPIGSGVPTLPTPSNNIPGFGSLDPDVLAELTFEIKVPYLKGELSVPTVIGGFSQDIEVVSGTSEYSVNVSGAEFKLGSDLSIIIGGNKTLSKKLNVATKAQRQPVNVGNLYLGDITGDNVINADDTTAFLSAVSNQGPLADVNLDGVGNSMDWAVIRAHFGKKGEK